MAAWVSVSELSSRLVYEPWMAGFIRNFLLWRLQIWSVDGCGEPRTLRGWVSVSGRCEQERGSGALSGSECDLGNNLTPCPASLFDVSLP